MKNLILRHVIRMSKLFTYAFLFQCMTMGFLLASNGNAQIKSIEEVVVSLPLEGVTVKEAFRKIEAASDYTFVYLTREVRNLPPVSVEDKDQSLYEVLVAIARQSGLDFKQINHNIHVQKSSKEPQTPLVSVSEADIEIRGTVTDENGDPIPGATVLIEGTSSGTATDIDGNFSLEAEEGAVLVISFIGYQSQRITVGNQTDLSITLTEDQSSLEEVVVVGYGTQKSRDLTTAVSKLSGEKLEDRTGTITRVDQALIGALAGVRVQEVSGQPGRPLSIKVRGTGSITAGSEPLYVIDGVPISGDLDNIAVGNIESIEVLKDAAASAIYGSRGANGVVIITTKKGKGGAPSVSVKTRYGFQQVAETYDVLNRDEWIDFAVEERTNTYLLNGGDPIVPLDERPGGARINPEWISNPENFPDTDWQALISRTAPIHNSQLSISGGTENTTYNIYADVFQQEGVIKHTDYNRYSFKANVETKIHDRVKVGLNISPSFSIQNEADAEDVGGPVSRAKFLAPIVEPNLGTVETGGEPYTRTDILVNPLAWLEETDDETKRFRTIGSFYAELEVTNNLSLRNATSADYSNGNNNFYKTNNVNRDNGSFAQASTFLNTNLLNETLLNYTVNTDNHFFTAIAGFSAQKFYNESTFSEVRGFPDDLVKTLNAGTELIAARSAASEHSLLSYFSRATYSLNDRYLFTASIRRDGSSRFGGNNKWGWFPSASVGWRISEEEFMNPIEFVNNLKLRASYGATGNYNIPNYGYIGSLSQTNYVLGDGSGVLVGGLSPSSFSNPELSWEKNNTLNIGMDIGLLENQFTLGVDAYRSVTSDLLLNVPIPVISGFSSSLQNIGKVENKGLEFELGARIVSTRDFSWRIDGNLAFNRNTVLELGPEGAPIPGFARGTSVTITQIGSPIGSYYLIPVAGIFMSEEELNSSPISKTQSVGDLKYIDTNEDGVITDEDKTIVGKNQPDYTWGLTQTIQFKSFDLSAMVYGESGFELINESQGGAGRSHVGNVLGYWRNRYVSPENPGDGKTPRAAVTPNLTTPSTFWMFDGSFWRIRNVTLGYNAPNSLLDNLGGAIAGLRVYLSAENVFTKDNYFGTPQTGVRNNSLLVPGIDATNTYPLAKSLVLGLNVTF
ncbi:TonB-linked outer membrane protein, SusC/RagA family [Cyclobacterium lianum]|uniref:TonB-linked outer membrane protein, SusC/RagA family n=1 Tax=Cyclobacterium lianum TaxID=388280 RepID=A0A1M7QNZ5_9BACT|nr:TonB-dependent receptor [Cyclobacterium lianum]SHN33114.1 TonB-linked outer membrane protein, SusC/RagA family [Cyclobacterium lianum]